MAQTSKTTTRDMTSGPILKAMILFALPLFLGNVFQLLYNTVDTLVVGNFVGKQALAAVGSTAMIINIVVFFFNGLSIGASVIIGQNFGAKDNEAVHTSIETTMAMTFISCVFFTILGVAFVNPMLRFMATPEDVIPEATIYLRIYFAGISGLLIYNMGSGILRAVGDTVRPLIFLIVTSVLNIILDLTFVLAFHGGIAGVAYATIVSQAISAILVLILLSTTKEIYRLSWKDLRIDYQMLKRIFNIGMPTAIQSTLTSFSNVFVQAYVNVFGSACMAGWSCFNKLEQFMFLPMHSMASSATTFVSQNTGAGNEKRVRVGTRVAIVVTGGLMLFIAIFLFNFAEPAVTFFSKEEDVIYYGSKFLRLAVFFLIFNCITHVLAGALRGRGDSKGPTYILILCFVIFRQIYLFFGTRFIANSVNVVGLGYPVGWMSACTVELIYYYIRYIRKPKLRASKETE